MSAKHPPSFIADIFSNIIAITNSSINATGNQLKERPSQVEVAQKLYNFFADKTAYQQEINEIDGYCLIEAPTGVGKSYAYLIPAILNESRTAIVTANKALQDQLFNQDLPAIKDFFLKMYQQGEIDQLYNPSFALLKGNENYICRLKLNYITGIHVDLEPNNTSIFDQSSKQNLSIIFGHNIVYKFDPLHKRATVTQTLFRSGNERKVVVEYPKKLITQLNNWANTRQDNGGDFANFKASQLTENQRKFIAHSPADCLRRFCPLRDKCFMYIARQQAAQADILITNNASFLLNLENETVNFLRDKLANHRRKMEKGDKDEDGNSLTPMHFLLADRQQFIVDEAHNFDEAIINFKAKDITFQLLAYVLNHIDNHAINDNQIEVSKLISTQDKLIEEFKFKLLQCLQQYLDHHEIANQGYSINILLIEFIAFLKEKNQHAIAIISNFIAASIENFKRISDYLINKGAALEDKLLEENNSPPENGKVSELAGQLSEIEYLGNELATIVEIFSFFHNDLQENTYRSDQFYCFFSYHIDNAEIVLSKHLLKADSLYKTIINTQLQRIKLADQEINYISRYLPQWAFVSATLTIDNQFKFFCQQMGINNPQQLIVDSPFNYYDHAAIYIDIDPTTTKLSQEIEAIAHNKGNVLWLCTSSRRVEELETTLYYRLQQHFKQQPDHRAYHSIIDKNRNPWQIYAQNQGFSKEYLLEQLRNQQFSVLIATRSFWEGVNLKGKSLSMVIIDKMPFPNIGTASTQYLKNIMGGRFFRDYYMPKTYSLLKQGIGRLIRSETDYGVIIIREIAQYKNAQALLAYISKEYANYYQTANFKELLSIIDHCQQRLAVESSSQQENNDK